MSHYITEDGINVNEIVVKKEITEDEEFELLNNALIKSYTGIEWKLFQPHHKKIFDKYKENISKIKKLESRVEQLETENKELKTRVDELTKKLEENNKIKKENLRLKIISGEKKSGWRQDRDMIERDNPITGKLEYYKCPVHFNHNRVRDKKYLDENRLMGTVEYNGV